MTRKLCTVNNFCKLQHIYHVFPALYLKVSDVSDARSIDWLCERYEILYYSSLQLWDARRELGLIGWLAEWVTFCQHDFSIYKRHELQTLHANSIWWEVNAIAHHFFNFLCYSEKNMRNLIFCKHIFQAVQLAWISNFTCEQHVMGDRCPCNFFLIFSIFPKNATNSVFLHTNSLNFKLCLQTACDGRSMHMLFFS